MPVVMIERQDETAIVWIDNPPVNALSQAVRAGIIDKVNEALADGEVVNQIIVPEDEKRWAKVALDRMLEIV